MSADNAGENLSDLAESSNSNDVNETKNNAVAADRGWAKIKYTGPNV